MRMGANYGVQWRNNLIVGDGDTMGIRRRISSDTFGTRLSCDICGRPAVWRDRVITPCCLYGEVLCDQCEGKRLARQANGDDFWADIVDFISWPFRALIGRLTTDRMDDLARIRRKNGTHSTGGRGKNTTYRLS